MNLKKEKVHTGEFGQDRNSHMERLTEKSVASLQKEIAERKQAEEALRRSERQYRTLVENQGEGIGIVDRNERFMFANPAAEKIFGVPPATLVGRNLREFTTPEVFENLLRQTEIRQRGETSVYDVEIIRPDGKKRVLLLTATPQYDENGQVSATFGIFRDITERKQMERELQVARDEAKEQNMRLRREIAERKKAEKEIVRKKREWEKTFDAVPDLIAILDENHGIVQVNKAMADGLGLRPEECIGKTCYKVVHGTEEPIACCPHTELLKDGMEHKLEVFEKNLNGHFLVTASPLFDEDGKLTGSVHVARDITERKQSEIALRLSEERFRAIFRVAGIGIALANSDGCFIQANPAFQDILGYSEKELVGMPVRKITHPDDLASSMRLRRELWEGKRDIIQIEKRYFRKDGEIVWGNLVSTTIKDESGTPIFSVGLLEDITSRKQMEEALKKETERAEAANRAKSEFLAGMSHEIRTPMTSILGFAEILELYVEDEKQKSYLKAIQSGGRGLLTLINDILDLSKIEAGKISVQYDPVDLGKFFHEMEQFFSLELSKRRIGIYTDISWDLPKRLYLDEAKLRQILINLIGNAVKFTEKGHIILCAHGIIVTENELDLIISVEDTGIGIPDESAREIFEAFKQRDGQDARKYSGTGLGLAITKRLVELMKGQIALRSRLNEGSVFRLHFKNVSYDRAPLVPEHGYPDTAKCVKFTNAVLLIVDDDLPHRIIVKEHLKGLGIRVIEARNGIEAIKCIETEKPDVVLMDIRMPEMGGYEAIRKIKKNPALKHVRVIAHTSAGMKEDTEEIVRSGFDDHLIKPAAKKELVKALSRYMPVSEIRKPEPQYDSAMKSLSESDLEKFADLANLLKKEFAPKWKDLRETLIYAEVGAFAEQVGKLGEKYACPPLTEWCDRVAGKLEALDVETLPGAFEQFGEIMKKLERIRKI